MRSIEPRMTEDNQQQQQRQHAMNNDIVLQNLDKACSPSP